MRTIETVAYQYNELSDEAKAKAREWYRSGDTDDFWSESVIDWAVRAGEILGIEFDSRSTRRADGSDGDGQPKIYWRGFWSQGDGASFEGSYHYAKGAAKRIRKEYPHETDLHRIADDLQAIQRQHFYKLCAKTDVRGHYLHSGCMQVDVWHDEDRYRGVGEAEFDLTDALRDFADWIYSQLEKEYDYQNSDEVVSDNIITNEYEFDENGKRI